MLLDAAYRDLKDARSLVDFADLELRARDLLLRAGPTWPRPTASGSPTCSSTSSRTRTGFSAS